jgi:hypothetical protein
MAQRQHHAVATELQKAPGGWLLGVPASMVRRAAWKPQDLSAVEMKKTVIAPSATSKHQPP